jgi:iron uptake system EfeUOB component EfeO/EfeM
MRTTIEVSDKHRSFLLALAAQKGLRGYSDIIREALDYYIEHQIKIAGKKKQILKMEKTWEAEETEQIRSNLSELRENWKQL